MHPRGPPFFPNVAVTVAEAVGVVDVVDAEDTVEVVEPETATKVSAPTAKLTAILQMHAENANALRREETTETMSTFASSAGSQATSKLIASPTNA
jgi:hypothetical protein